MMLGSESLGSDLECLHCLVRGGIVRTVSDKLLIAPQILASEKKLQHERGPKSIVAASTPTNLEFVDNRRPPSGA